MKIDGVIVVEGKSDVAFLSNFIEAEFVTTNGSEIPDSTIEYLKEISSKSQIYVLTDPDSPGEKIRAKLNENIPNLKHCFVKKENSIKKGKVGVAESTKEEILEALKNAITSIDSKKNNIDMSDLSSLGLTGTPDANEKREKVANKLHLGHCNAKTFLKRLNYCDITIDELKKML